MSKKKYKASKVTLQFNNNEQAEVFFSWFKEYGFDALCDSDMVHDDLPSELFYDCINREILPGKYSDENYYYVEIQ